MEINGYTIEPEADLFGADLRGANLCGANLYRADLYRANLYSADLFVANLEDCTGNGEEIRTLICLPYWIVTYTSDFLQISCEGHLIDDWWRFDDQIIAQMDPKALDWWHEHKDWLRATIERYPATPTTPSRRSVQSPHNSAPPEASRA